CGALFLVKELNGYHSYRPLFFPGQSETVRWRAFYFLTFDWSCAALALAGWILGIWLIVRLLRNRSADVETGMRDGTSKECICLALWSLGSTAMLAAFYLRVPCISSRYMMDFAPAFAGGIGVFWLKLSAVTWQRRWMRQTFRWGLLIILICWICVEIGKDHPNSSPRSATWEQISSKTESSDNKANLPKSMYSEGFDFQQTGIPGNGVGWEDSTNAVAPTVVLFIKNPEFLELEVSAADGKILDNPPFIRAKVGLDLLRHESSNKVPKGWILKFSRPMRGQHQHGILPLFLAFGPKEGLANKATLYRLLKVSWGEDPK